jgi:acyl-CoA reductase-like NAD-dependent aldehyde dehydrogenase
MMTVPAPSSFEVADPRTGAVITQVVPPSLAHVDRVVADASSALEDWSRRSPAERIDAVRTLASAWDSRADDLVAAVTRELGQPERFTRTVHVEGPLKGLHVLIDAAQEIQWSRDEASMTIERVGAGVVAALTPWNYPVHQIVAKVGAALLAGCTVVVKPSELAPLSARVLADASVGVLPPGVLTFVEGDASTGSALASDPRIDVVSFTGGGATGAAVSTAAAAHHASTVLELGGKSAGILLDDLDPDAFARACRYVVAETMSNAGQTCNALTRLVVPRSRKDEAVAAVQAAAARYKPEGLLGPVRTAASVDRIIGVIDAAVAGGAEVVVDGRASSLPTEGFWVGPWVLAVDADDPIAVYEVFGPVLCLIAYDDGDSARRDAEAIRVAQRSPYALSAAVFGADVTRAETLGRRLRVGQVRVNGAAWDHRAPFGGFGASGVGREWGREGIEQLTTTRTILR